MNLIYKAEAGSNADSIELLLEEGELASLDSEPVIFAFCQPTAYVPSQPSGNRRTVCVFDECHLGARPKVLCDLL